MKNFFKPLLFVGAVVYLNISFGQTVFDPDPTGYWSRYKTTYGSWDTSVIQNTNPKTMTPAQIIFYGSLENNINPITILAFIQKEQGLIRNSSIGDPTKFQTTINAATGYGVYARLSDRVGYKGFFPQIVGTSFQINKWGYYSRTFDTFRANFNTYQNSDDPATESAYDQTAFTNFVSAYNVYQQYLLNGGRISQKNNDYFDAHKNLTEKDIQFILESEGSVLKDTRLFGFGSTSAASLPPRFDGVGSLVNPTDPAGCVTGCKTDVVKLHSHADTNQRSVGVFQVFKFQNSCSSVEIDGLENAHVEVRPWNGYGTNSKYYNVKSLPAQIPLADNQWSLISVTTTAPIEAGGTRNVTATCLRSVPNPYDTNVEEVTGSPLAFEADYFWGGNGSLISYTVNSVPGIGLFGTRIDYAALLRDKKSLSAFQVDSSKCPKVKLQSDYPFQVSWKAWNVPNWQDDTRSWTDVNHTFDSGNRWWILKIKAEKTGANGSVVKATCVQ